MYVLSYLRMDYAAMLYRTRQFRAHGRNKQICAEVEKNERDV